MLTVIWAVLHPLVLMWAAILFYALQDAAFPAAFMVAILGYALVELLLRRIGPYLKQIIGALLLMTCLGLAVADASVREGVWRIVQDLVWLNGPRSIVVGLVATFIYGVQHSGRGPSPA